MARRRYISTEISIDKDVNQLAIDAGDFAAMLYTWMIPHAQDDCTLTGDPDELMYTIIPRRRDKTEEDVIYALDAMDGLGLIVWDREGSLISFPPESFYKYQTYIAEAKRVNTCVVQRTSPQNTEDHRKTPENTVSPSPSPSPSLSPKGEEKPPIVPLGTRKPFRSRKQQDQFDQFWQQYPRKKSKGQAEKAWAKINPDEQLQEAILNGLERAKTSGDWQKNNGEFILHPATWLNAKGWEDEHGSLGAPNEKPLTEQRRKEVELIKELYHT